MGTTKNEPTLLLLKWVFQNVLLYKSLLLKLLLLLRTTKNYLLRTIAKMTFAKMSSTKRLLQKNYLKLAKITFGKNGKN